MKIKGPCTTQGLQTAVLHCNPHHLAWPTEKGCDSTVLGAQENSSSELASVPTDLHFIFMNGSQGDRQGGWRHMMQHEVLGQLVEGTSISTK